MNGSSRTNAATLWLIAMFTIVPALARAQVSPPPQLDDASRPRIHVRGLSMNPSVAVTNAGIDTNVFNSVVFPQRDFTMTLSPALDSWVRAGRARLAMRGQMDLVYFQKFVGERSIDGGVGAKLDMPLNRLNPWMEGGTYSGRQRVGYEIDVRSRHRDDTFGLGVGYRFGANTSVSLGAHRDTTKWDGDATFFGTSLSRTLDRTSDSATLTYQQHLTVLTTFVAEASAQRDRFAFATDRNTDSTRGVVGFNLESDALINGTVRVGYRRFDPVSGGFEPFQGVVAAGTVSYVLHGSTRFEVDLQRDAQYSFEPAYPYYVQTGATVTLTQRLTSRWDVQGRFGRQQLAYRVAQGAIDALPSRLDRIHAAGGGIGYRLNRGVRFGINVDRNERHSPLVERQYGGFKAGASVTYVR